MRLPSALSGELKKKYMYNNMKTTLNAALIRERQSRRWSQQDVADRIGTTRNNVSRWERGITAPDPHFRQKLSELFGRSSTELGLFSKKGKGVLVPPAAAAQEQEALPAAQLELPSADPIAIPDYWSIPHPRNPYFTGREQLLEMMHAQLAQQNTPQALSRSYALNGLGGVGKTQLALEYAYRYNAEYNAIFWINAETYETLYTSFLLIAEIAQLPEQKEQDQPQFMRAITAWLNHRQNWLLIFDNVEDLDLLLQFLPPAYGGALLLTTRLQVLRDLAQPLRVEPMSIAEGCTFLLQRANLFKPDHLPSCDDMQIVCEIVAEMDGLPLALDQAAAYLEATRCRLSDYLQLWHASPTRLLNESDPSTSHPFSVTKTFALAFERLERDNPAAAIVLTACVFLAPEAIPEIFFRVGATALGSTFVDLAQDAFAFQTVIKSLLAYSLVQRQSEAQMLTIHRLVQVIYKESLPLEVQQAWTTRIIQAMNMVFPDKKFQTNYWRVCEQLIPHALVCMHMGEQWHASIREYPELICKIAHYFVNIWRLDEAKLLYEQTLHVYELILGPETLDSCVALNGLANIAVLHNQYHEGERLCLRALRVYEQILEADDPRISNTLNNLGILSYEQGNYSECEQYHSRALQIRKQKLGIAHPLFASSLNNLAVVYAEQGRYDDAITFNRRALYIWEEALGAAHTQLALPLFNLAEVYIERGDYMQAELSCRHAIEILEQALGPDEPSLAFPLLARGRLCFSQKDFHAAEQYYQRALELRKHLPGLQALTLVGQVVHGQANLAREQGAYERAAELYQQSLELFRTHGGMRHPYVANLLSDFARLYQQIQQPVRAYPLHREALEIYELVLGSQHYKTIEARATCALILNKYPALRIAAKMVRHPV